MALIPATGAGRIAVRMPTTPSEWTADRLRQTWTNFFANRGHEPVASSGLIPLHPAAPLFANAGMNQFLPFFMGEEPPAWPRATTVQKCVRIMGKHDDIENIGRSKSHLTFFEMLGNFSFGDYFKEGAIKLAWELITEQFGYDPSLIWVTVHESDDVAEQLWLDLTTVPKERIQRLAEDNFWEMGDTGPCGPCSEIFLDKGAAYGHDGGPSHGADARYLEFWNLVFMQYERQSDSSLVELPKQNVDTGAGYERNLCLLQGVDSVFDTDLFTPLLAAASDLTGVTYGKDEECDVSLRIMADHARSVAFLINDGVFPSNTDRGYVLRRILRRAVRRAYSLGIERQVMAGMVDAVVANMGGAYPDLVRNRDFVSDVVEREEGHFRSTLRRGMTMLDEELSSGTKELSGAAAFKLHDTFGFPIEVTREVATERGVTVDQDGFAAEMEAQRDRARAAAKGAAGGEVNAEVYRDLLEATGPTRYVGDKEPSTEAMILAVMDGEKPGSVEVFLDRTSFYAESGGQVGDSGTITTLSGTVTVEDTIKMAGALFAHKGTVEGTVKEGQTATATIDWDRRLATRRNHTATHLMHWALRDTLGEHVKQQGSLVNSEYLRFDFSHFGAMTPEEIRDVEDKVNHEVLTAAPTVIREMTKAEAEAEGAVAFFGEKYGETVRVLDAGPHSRELCGGSHVSNLGEIGLFTIVREESVASNTRRIFAYTGMNSLAKLRHEQALLHSASCLLKTNPEELPEAVQRAQSLRKGLEEQIKQIRASQAAWQAKELVASSQDGIVTARVDDVADLKSLAAQVRSEMGDGARAVVLIGSPDGKRVALAAAVTKGSNAVDLLKPAAAKVGGGAGGKGDLGQAGGRDPSGIDDALAEVRRILAEQV